jgi:hypothetical protein
MTDSKLQAAIDRRINDTYSEGVDGIHERLDDDSKLATAFIERHLAGDFADAERFRLIQEHIATKCKGAEAYFLDRDRIYGATFREAIDNATARLKQEDGK